MNLSSPDRSYLIEAVMTMGNSAFAAWLGGLTKRGALSFNFMKLLSVTGQYVSLMIDPDKEEKLRLISSGDP